MRRFACTAAFLAVTALAHESAQAQLVFSFSAPTLGGLPGTTVHFGGTLTNSRGTTFFLNGESISLAAGALTINDTPFFINVPAFLTAGGMYSGPLFDITI